MIGVDTLQALLETSELRANLAEGKVEALRMKVATSLEVIEDLRDQIRLLEAELADVRDLVPVDGDDDDFLDDNLAKHTVGQAWFLRSIGLDVEELAVHCDCVAHLAQCRSGK